MEHGVCRIGFGMEGGPWVAVDLDGAVFSGFVETSRKVLAVGQRHHDATTEAGWERLLHGEDDPLNVVGGVLANGPKRNTFAEVAPLFGKEGPRIP